MPGSLAVAAAAVAFVGSHFALSHPLRRAIVGRIGGSGFLALYSAVAFLTLGGMAWAYRVAPTTQPIWVVQNGLWAVVTVLMLLAAILLIGSLVGNPALPNPTGPTAFPGEPRGVFAITRHPMMWAFALWGLCHILVYPVAKNMIVAVAIIVLALAGAALQDGKKAKLDPIGWPAWEGKTSYWPFAAIVAGRARLGWPGLHAVAGGLVVWLAATWAHIPLAGWPAGIWRWLAI